MQIIVTGRHLEITVPIRAYAEQKMGKLPRYFDRIVEIEMVASKPDPREFEVEIKVDAEHITTFVAKTTGTDLYACIDETVDKLERQLTDHKTRLRNRKHNV